MGTLKAAAATRGIVLGVGPTDTTGPAYPGGVIPASHSWAYPPTPVGGYVFARPLALDAATDPEAALIINEFGGALDLCAWAVGNTDYSHYGQTWRWTGPGQYNFAGMDEAYAWAIANGMRVWMSDPAYSGVPTWLVEGKNNGTYSAADVTTLLHDWYTAVFSRYPLAYATTFLNEMCPWVVDLEWDYGDPGQWLPIYRTGSNYSTKWYQQNSTLGSLNNFAVTLCGWVKAASPGVRIVINDFDNDGLQTGSTGMVPTDHAGEFKDWIVQLKGLGADIAGAGLQCHLVGSGVYSIPSFKAAVAAYVAAGLEVHITEFDVSGGTPAGNAQRYFDLVKGIVETPAITTLNFWSIRDPLFYGTTGALYSQALVPTASRDAVERALLGLPLGVIGQRLAAGGAVVSSRRTADASGGAVISTNTPRTVQGGAVVGASPVREASGAAIVASPGYTQSAQGAASVQAAIDSAVQAGAYVLDDTGPVLRRWTGTEWVRVDLKWWNGLAYNAIPIRRQT